MSASDKPLAAGAPIAAAPIPTAKAWRRLLASLFGLVALFCLSLLLPDPAYLRYQLSAHTIQFHSWWIYQRIHDDPTPIDVAVVGTSKAQDGVSPVALEDDLSRELGRPIHVAAFGMVDQGRNLHYAIVKELLATRPEVKMLVVQVEASAYWSGHPLFRYIADDWDVIRSPVVSAKSYFTDLLYLPMRHILCFSESLFPSLFDVQTSFDPSKYDGPRVDWTKTFIGFDGSLHNNDHTSPVSVMLSETGQPRQWYIRLLQKLVPKSIPTAVEYTFTKDIVKLAKAHGVSIVFVNIPVFENREPIQNPGFYESRGRYFSALNVANQPLLYSSGPHLNHDGAIVLSDWLATKIGPLLAAREGAKTGSATSQTAPGP
jgi:hypothetical protein